MASLVHTLYDGYTYLTDDLVSPLTKDWFLVGQPLNLIVILVSYLYFCKTLGPWYMKDKKPYKFKTVIKIYNLFQIFISLYLFYEGTRYVFFTDFNFRCQGLNDPSSLEAKQIAYAIWVFYMVKIMDLMDTVFFVLRKSNRQITQLHLHHHTLMPVVSWIAVTYIPGGQCVLTGYINSLVHAVMYTYYLLAGLGDEYKKYLWWKKYLTMLQLVQFAIIGAHSTNSLFYSCSYPLFFKILACFYAIMFINMFGQFYYNNYIKSKNNATKNGMINEKKTETNAHGKTPKARNAMNSFNMINK